LDNIIKCGLGLTKTEFKIMKYFIKITSKKCTTSSISKKLKLNLITIQKAVKKLLDDHIIIRYQKNLDNGGYVYTYECNSKYEFRKIIKGIIRNWSNKIEDKIDSW